MKDLELKVAICDDNPEDLFELRRMLMEYDSESQLEILEYSSADDFLGACEKVSFDIALLDIEMTGTNGYEAARILSKDEKHPILIFVTQSLKYTVCGYGVAFRYLVKPLTMKSLGEAMDSAINEVSANSFIMNIDGVSHVVRMNDIYYFEVYSHSTILHTADETFSLRYPLKEIMDMLPQGYFAMPHRSYIVNLNHVKSFSMDSVKLTNGVTILMSRRKFAEFNSRLVKFIER